MLLKTSMEDASVIFVAGDYATIWGLNNQKIDHRNNLNFYKALYGWFYELRIQAVVGEHTL